MDKALALHAVMNITALFMGSNPTWETFTDLGTFKATAENNFKQVN